MLSIPGYQITEVLHKDAKTLVYRGHREHDQFPVIFKTLVAEYPARKDLARLQHEYALTKDWVESDLFQAHDLVPYQNNLVLISEDIGGSSIRKLLDGKAMTVGEFLPLAIAFSKHLGKIHQHKIIHKDINPANLLLNRASGQVQIIDFGIASQLSRETAVLQNPGHLEGTLAYLSPEQTGRMNRSVDYRSDFYSLGATFYEMLTGRPPFAATDSMELVHCHLAKMPPLAHEQHPGVPPILSQLVQKLMAKTAEQRYQSAFGLIADLEVCQQQWLATGQTTQQRGTPSIADFDLGQQDVPERFQIPQKLYGREAEIAQLLNSFARVSRGPAEMLLVAGYSGVGKTALVYEVHKPVTESQGYFIAGKFDQFQRDIPYASLIVAFQELMRQLLTESPAQIARWKALLEQALGVNAQVIMKVIPEVEWIMGPQPAVPELPPNQAQNRFNFVFQQFIRTFASKEHPLVLFLDDLQWADFPSLKLIQLFMTEPDTRYLLVIGAYRDNEVSAAHPLMLTLEEISEGALRIGALAPTTLTLPPLDEGHIRQLLAETLNFNPLLSEAQNPPQGELDEPCERAALAALAKLCFEKTQGNPFFLNQFLRTLVEAQQIVFNHVKGRWQWDIEILKQTPITNNVVELMAEKIRSLPANTQAVLQLAACIGNQFDLKTLALAWERSAIETSQALWPAVQADLLIPLDQSYGYLTFNVPSEANFDFKFAHDRIQQAAYSFILDASKAAIHLRIGRLLLAHLAPTAENTREERIFDLVYHLNRGRELLTELSEKEQLARLNLSAGRKAKSSAAYKPALVYFQIGLALVGEQGWETHYELTLALSVAATEAAYFAGDFEQMDQLGQMGLRKGKTLLDQVKVYEVQIQACIVRDQGLEAIQIALPVLKRLGVTLSSNPNKLHLIRGLLETKWALRGKRVEDLAQLPLMREGVPLAAMQIISSIIPAAYVTQPDLLPLLVFKQISLTVRYGSTALSAFAYAAYGLILCSSLGEIELGYRFGNLATNSLAASTLAHLSANAPKAKIGYVVEGFIRHWKDPYRQRLQPLLEAYQNGVETGDFEYAAYAVHDYGVFHFFTGRELPALHEDIKKYAVAMVQYKQELSFGWQKMIEQMVLNLLGPCEDPCHFSGPIYDEDLTPNSESNRTSLFRVGFYKMMLCYLFGQYPRALEQAVVAEEYIDAVMSSSADPVCRFYMALVWLAILPQRPRAERAALLKKVAGVQKKMRQWAQHAPMNYQHKWLLVEAERARVKGADFEAMAYYEQAITLARENGFPHEAAIANELTAQFLFARGQEKFARPYLQDAYYGYQQWGAGAKVHHMETQYPFLAIQLVSHTATYDTSTSVLRPEALDLSTVMKATQAISGEIVLERLLEKLMRILIESAGAQHGMLLLETNGEWRIEAQGSVDEENVRVLQSLPLVPLVPLMPVASISSTGSALPTAPVALIQSVVLTKESVVLDNAAMQGRFTNDPYISQHLPKSVLCAPILQQGKLVGILYLENKLIEGAFTAERLEVLKMLSSQAAISIENARAYENLEATLERRTVALKESNMELDLAKNEANQALTAEKAKVDSLLLNILPKPIAERLKHGETNIADHFDQVAILFADLVGFTQFCSEVSSSRIVSILNEIFCAFDTKTEELGMEKIKTIGDGYMAMSGGLSTQTADLLKTLELGHFMIQFVEEFNIQHGLAFKIRVGVHVGAVTAGVIGKTKFAYDIWGDTVNVASRMESTGTPMRIQISEDMANCLPDKSMLTYRGVIAVKGKGMVKTYLIDSSYPLCPNNSHKTEQE